MSMRIKISYESPQELQEVLERLGSMVQSYRVPKRQEKTYKRAYICLQTQDLCNDMVTENQGKG